MSSESCAVCFILPACLSVYEIRDFIQVKLLILELKNVFSPIDFQ